MYLEFFKLREHPFLLTSDPRFLYLSKAHAQARAYIDYALSIHDSVVIITGEIGSGKTTVLQDAMSRLDRDVIVARIHQTQLNEQQFLQTLYSQFGFKAFEAGKAELLDKINSYLIEQHTKDKKVVLVVDEAQHLSTRILEEIRFLSDLEHANEKILNVILVAQPELNTKLEQAGMEQLLQRVRLRFHISELNQEETEEYIEHRLQIAGCKDPELFKRSCVKLIHQFTGGVPRLINVLCDVTLAGAFAEQVDKMGARQVKAAIEELQWVPYGERFSSKTVRSIEASVTYANDQIAKLVLTLNGSHFGDYPLDKECLRIGRGPDNDIQIDNPIVSRHHAMIIRNSGSLVLEDLDSANGTFVNFKRIKTRALHDGDIVTIGVHKKVMAKLKIGA